MNHEPFPYQKRLIDDVLAEFDAGISKDTVLAAACGAGKTFMGISIIEALLLANPTFRILVLTHGQVILRSQFIEDIEDECPAFTYTAVESATDLEKDVQVYVGLPHTIHRCENLRFDVVLVDEAHQFYWAKDGMVQSIIKSSKPRFTLLLTGSPSKFIKEQYKLYSISLLELFEQGRVCSPTIELAKSRYVYTHEDYNAKNDELKEQVQFTPQQTDDTLDDLLTQVEGTLRSAIRTRPTLRNKLSLISDWKLAFQSLGKTMFVCRSQEQAWQVAKYFRDKEMDVALSTSDEDADSTELGRFKKDPTCLVCIVVNRATLGFNYPELVNIVDLAGSKNVDVLFQTFSRLVRKHPDGKEKLYFKVVPEQMAGYNWALMGFVLALSHKRVYDSYSGDYKRTKIPLLKDYINKTKETGEQEMREGRKPRELKFEELPPLPRFDVFKNLWSKDGELLSSYAYTTLKDVKNYFNIELEQVCREVAAYLKRVGKTA